MQGHNWNVSCCCYPLNTKRPGNPLLLFTDAVTFTHDGINNTNNSHQYASRDISLSGRFIFVRMSNRLQYLFP